MEDKILQILVISEDEYKNVVNLLQKYFKSNCDGCKVGKYPKRITLNIFYNDTNFHFFTNHANTDFKTMQISYSSFIDEYNIFMETTII